MNKRFWCALVLAAAGCGDDNRPANLPDAGMDAPDAADHGAPSTTFPAFTVDMPTLRNVGGSVIQNMHIVTVTWSTDTNVATFNAMSDGLGASNYWMAITHEYGVGPTTSVAADHVSITTTPPATLTDAQLLTLVQQNAGTTWPAPTTSTLYLIYTHPSTTIMFGGQAACGQIGGYHDETVVGGTKFPFAVVLGCTAPNGVNDETTAASSMFNAAATDPTPMSNPAFAAFDPDHLNWVVLTFFADETSLACQGFASSFFTDAETGFMFAVQRGWSNDSAHAGHNPCVPPPPGAYFNVTPLDPPDTITTTLLGNPPAQTHGYKANLGQPRTFAVGFYSDRATTGPFTLAANVPANFPNGGQNGVATVSVDKTSGVNGEKSYVTVTPTTFNAQGVVLVILKSTLNGTSNLQPILIGQ